MNCANTRHSGWPSCSIESDTRGRERLHTELDYIRDEIRNVEGRLSKAKAMSE